MDTFSSPSQAIVIKRQLYTQSEIDETYVDQSPTRTACLGFGILSSLTPAVGLYSTFFPILVYLIFGTSPHVSMGTNAVIAILTANLVDRESDAHQLSLGANNTLTEDELLAYKIGISMAACFVGGLILMGMGIFRLGFLTNFLAKSFIGGFTFSAAVHITTSQIVKMLHVRIPGRSGLGKLVLTYIDIFKNITTCNPADIIVGLICMAVLLAVKIGINERYKAKMKVPVPIELIVVILSTLISHFAKLHDKFGIGIVGYVPTGIPPPSLPPMDALPRVATDAFVIAILCFALTISLGKLCSKIHGNKMDDNQELIAYGLCHFIGSFFQNFPSCTAPPRTMMQSSLGAKSTLNGVSSAVFILLVLLVAGQLFVSLPIAMLAAMIIVAMKDLLLQIRNLRSLWHVNKPDFFIWLLTAVASVFGDLDIGLLVGVVFSMVTVLVVSQLADGKLLGRAESEDVVMDTQRKGIRTVPGVRIFRFESQLYFASQERFKRQLYTLVFDPTKLPAKEMAIKVPVSDSSSTDSAKAPPETAGLTSENEDKGVNGIHHVILDCSALTYIDVAGIDMLSTVMKQFSRVGVDVFLAAVPSATLATLNRAGFFDTCSKDKVFYTVFDALTKAREAGIIVISL
nr:hypothetical protein BaRGS_028567 [Batillaria attramentaria]